MQGETSIAVRKRKSKTFTGCFTCRSRKIRCDLQRPFCQNCKKAGWTCGGYNIKLRWLTPVQFKRNGRNPLQKPVVFEKEKEAENDAGTSAFFQRRHVGFVTWNEKKNFKPYETYEEIDQDLNALRGSDKLSDTTLKGPFGVFAPNGIPKTTLAHPNLTDSISSPVTKQITPGLPDISNHGNEHMWLSNELREHALLTAAALNGDPQFLDLDVQPYGYQSIPDSLSDLLNFLFHKTSQNQALNSHSNPLATPSNHVTSQAPSTRYSPSVDTMSIPEKQGLESVAINQGNQHLFYSNFNNFYYNNPYQPNETLEIQLHASSLKHDDESTDLVEGDTSQTTQMPEALMSIVRSPLQPKLGFDVSLPKNGVLLPTTALLVEPLTRYLLNYYVTQVADLMTVIPLTENPWKTIYFPRALMAIGELSALGKTSIAKNALLNALLAVSAFNLQSKFTKNSNQMKFYLNLGIRLRNQASLFVKALLDSHGNTQNGIAQCVASEKYKDTLCAVMSMISVDLVWGTMQDTNFYIRWCEKVIYTKMKNKKKLSAKGKILHRIFLSLKLIQDSTCLDVGNIKDDFKMTSQFGYDVKTRFEVELQDNKTKSDIKYIMDGSVKSSPMFVNMKLINTNKNDENFATDALYGLPNSLISLFSETVQLLRKKIYHRDLYNAEPENFQQQSFNLKTKLQSWKLDWKLYEGNDANKSFFTSMHEATFHHIMSFYHALSIYFNRLIMETPPEEVQDKVAKTLGHLNLIQRLIAKDEAHIIPLFWQGFIAGCEAVSPDLQSDFKKWGADIAQYLGSYWGARQIMLEVWRRKKVKETRDDWVCVIQDWDMNLMLN
ncbi:hypothetical protein METBIDRAFT_34561 [Metschnikowia bicuspidata var. bicuspidata NRRL YB-4993]|uniref:Zn(2)-C6 fungal-type domain-containing protein n=1 Tax=Metschnikowia bicuspidata var. bicuspidata NRRL YB-4993 TaxID=869754 RepID=A0A1A0HL41_9ASCO|nr:hypothetical protein METBIDRAFT_34561 [Metschnikowia bicuspidata var. bicuspidata NRRL YB-4993]OBA24528.1 hypothetical protein METBIDRAFT_34561 [Metschnikowia bicuspidata var. bicuspidata NRRL YB-4993]